MGIDGHTQTASHTDRRTASSDQCGHSTSIHTPIHTTANGYGQIRDVALAEPVTHQSNYIWSHNTHIQFEICIHCTLVTFSYRCMRTMPGTPICATTT